MLEKFIKGRERDGDKEMRSRWISNTVSLVELKSVLLIKRTHQLKCVREIKIVIEEEKERDKNYEENRKRDQEMNEKEKKKRENIICFKVPTYYHIIMYLVRVYCSSHVCTNDPVGARQTMTGLNGHVATYSGQVSVDKFTG